MISSSIIKNAYFTSSCDGDIKKVLKDIKSDVNFAEMKQTHSSDVKVINNVGIYDSDGIETNIQDLPLVVRVADCIPILMKSNNLISVLTLPPTKYTYQSLSSNLASIATTTH